MFTADKTSLLSDGDTFQNNGARKGTWKKLAAGILAVAAVAGTTALASNMWADKAISDAPEELQLMDINDVVNDQEVTELKIDPALAAIGMKYAS